MEEYNEENLSIEHENEYGSEEEKFEPQMMAEVSAYERIGFRGQTIQEGENQYQKKQKDPEEYFTNSINMVSNELNNLNSLRITSYDIENMIEFIPKIKKIEFINPTGYVLGYMASNGGGKEINKRTLDTIFKKILPQLKNFNEIVDSSITKADVIRYSRYWIMTLK